MKFLSHSARWTRQGLEALAIVSGLVLLVVLLLAGRLAQGPLDVGFARDYIEDALADPATGTRVAADDLILTWPQLRGPLQLELRNLRILHGGVVEVGIERAQLSLSRVMLLAGQIAPVRIVLSRPTLHLVRGADNHVSLSLAPVTPEKPGTDPLAHVVAMLSQERKLFDFRNPLAHLQSLEITDASMVMEDHILGISWYLQHLDLSFAHDPQGLVMISSLHVPGGRSGESGIFTSAIYRRQTNDYGVTLHVTDLDPRIISRKIDALSPLNDQAVFVSGDVSATLDAGLHLRTAEVQLTAPAGQFVLPTLYTRPLAFQALAVQASFDRDRGEAQIRKLDIAAGGVTATLAGQFKVNGDHMSGPVTAAIPAASQAQIAALWPDLLHGGAQTWLTQRMSAGQASNIGASLILDAGMAPWSVKASAIKGDFDIAGATVDYRAPLWPAKNASGHGHFEKGTLDIGIDKAAIGDMAASHGRVTIDRIGEAGTGAVKIALHIDGKLASVFSYVGSPPLNLDAQKIGINMAALRGTAGADIGISFPAIKDLLASQVVVTVDGELHDVTLPGIIKDIDLTSPLLKLSVADGAVALHGDGQLGGRAATVAWQKYVSSAGHAFGSQVVASIATDDALRTRLGLGLEDYLKGTAPAQVTYTDYGAGRAEAQVSADLTPADFVFSPLGYDKPPGAAGSATAHVIFKDGSVQSVENVTLQGPALQATGGRVELIEQDGHTKIHTAHVDRLQLFETDSAADIEMLADGTLKLGIKGASFDARAVLKHKNPATPYTGPPIDATLAADQVRTRDGFLLHGVTGAFLLDRQGLMDRLALDATAGTGKLAVRLQPDAQGTQMLSLLASDAGYTLGAFDVYDNIAGGNLVVNGRAAAGQMHLLAGHAALNDFRVTHAPVLARLVNSLSLTGLPALLGGEGVHFAKLECDFTWATTPAGDLYTLDNGRTAGSSLALTFKGTIDKTRNAVDVTGDAVPLSGVNGLLNGIPVINDILTGGKNGGIFAATYTVRGPTENPDVTVNPLSMLAPGILRHILFEQ